jgi:hypothetical protein
MNAWSELVMSRLNGLEGNGRDPMASRYKGSYGDPSFFLECSVYIVAVQDCVKVYGRVTGSFAEQIMRTRTLSLSVCCPHGSVMVVCCVSVCVCSHDQGSISLMY